MSDMNERISDLIRRIKEESMDKQSQLKPSGSQLKPNLKQLDKWAQRNEPKKFPSKPKSSIETPKVQPLKQPESAFEPSHYSEEDWNGMKMRALISLTELRHQVIALQTNAFLESPLFKYVQAEIEQLAEAVNEIEGILKLDIDKANMSEMGIHEYEPFLKKREQLLLKFKK